MQDSLKELLPRLLAVLLLAVSLSTAAAEKKVKYVPPEGCGGRTWGELRSTFDRLPAEPIGVGAGYILPVLKKNEFFCVVAPGVPTGGPMTSSIDGCDFRTTLERIYGKYEGGGFYVLSEYVVPEQGYRMGDEQTGVTLHPVVWQFCANWNSSVKKKVPPPNFDDINKFCGVRLGFQSETREELSALPVNHVTVYDRMLDLLVAKYGKPRGYLRRGTVEIETEEGRSTERPERKFSTFRWCPAMGNGLHTDCEASVVMTLDPITGHGTVLYSTPLVWEYAYARDTNKKGDRLYRILHARR